MKILKVNIEDFKLFKNFNANLDGKNILLIGENGKGKSTFMQFIEICLGKQTEIPIGAEGNGYIIADKNGKEWKFQVKFKNGKPFVTITSPEGLTDTSKSALANIVGSIDFDINEFVGWSDTDLGRKKQVKKYLEILPKETQDFITQQEQRVETSFKKRTELNSEVKTLIGALAEHKFKKYLEKLPEKPIDITELSKTIEVSIKANEKHREILQRVKDREQQLKDIAVQISQLNAKTDEINKMQEAADQWLETNPITDITDLTKQKDDAFAINTALEDKADYDKKMEHLNKVKEECGEMTAFIESSREVIADAIKDCPVPVDGLSYDSEGLVYNGIPVSTANLSTSEIIHLGIKLKIAANPDFGVMFIEHGESIGNERLKAIQEIAKEHDFQIILEEVRRGQEQLIIELMAEL